LKKGELQVSTLERNSQLQNIQKDIIQIIAEKTINPTTQRPYPTTMIEKVLADLHYSISATKSAKQQVRSLNQHMIPKMYLQRITI
jgi:ribosome maturation protein SDO1